MPPDRTNNDFMRRLRDRLKRFDERLVDVQVAAQGLPGPPGPTGPAGGDGTDGTDGHSPVLTWGVATDADRILVDGVASGPHLTGPAGSGEGTSAVVVTRQSAQAVNSSSSTPTDIPGLAFALTAGHRYHFKFMVTYQSVATTTGCGFVFSAPAMTAANYKVEIRQGGAGTDMMYTNSVVNNLATVLVSASVAAANTPYVATVEGFCQPSADGTLQLRVRSEVNGSAVTVLATGIGMLTDCG